MKTIFLAVSILFMSSVGHCFETWRSSNTATSTGAAPSVKALCTETQRGILHGVCTGFGVASSSIEIVNSTFTYTGVKVIGPITTLVADQCKYYDTVLDNWMGYHKPNTATVTILYDCY
jgi:hypothetical protein